jgi:hypothetical protein
MIAMALIVERVGSAWMSSSNFEVGSGRLKACSAMRGLSSIMKEATTTKVHKQLAGGYH